MPAAASAVWAGLGLSAAALSASAPTPPAPALTPADAARALAAPPPAPSFAAASRRASAAAVAAARAAAPAAARAAADAPRAAAAFGELARAAGELDGALAACGRDVRAMQEAVGASGRRGGEAAAAAEHVEAFVEEVMLEPALVRHVVDGKVGEERYGQCLGVLRKKVAVFEMGDTRRAAVYRELRPVLDRLVDTAAARVRAFLLDKVDLLRRPSTNVHIIKQSVLLRHGGLVRFLDELSRPDFVAVRDAYVHTIGSLYRALFARYATALMALKVPIGADAAAAALSTSSAAAAAAASGLSLSSAPLIGVAPQAAGGAIAATSRSLSGLFGGAARGHTVVTGEPQARPRPASVASPSRRGGGGLGASPAPVERRNSIGSAVDATNAAAAAPSSVSLVSLGNRIDVLAKIDSPAIVLAVAEDNDLRFYYEELHRSLGWMLSETCASESAFCDAFFGDHAHALFPVLFDDVVALLLDAVTAHASASHDMVGILLALKVNEAQRTSMQAQDVLDLSHYFIRVDIALKPKFKRLFDANISSLSAAAAPASSRAHFNGEFDTNPHLVTRQFADLSASILAISAYGATDDAVLDGMRRMRTEFVTFLTAVSALFTKVKSRYTFLVNNIDLVLTVYAARGVDSSAADARFFNELHVGHTAAYVEHEVADHFPDLVSFVRDDDRRARSLASASPPGAASAAAPAPPEAHVRSVLREFASNWHLGVGHMRDSVLRAFPNFRAGSDILRALFARLFAYHRRCEAIIAARYPTLSNELVSGTEISYEVRLLSKPFA